MVIMLADTNTISIPIVYHNYDTGQSVLVVLKKSISFIGRGCMQYSGI